MALTIHGVACAHTKSTFSHNTIVGYRSRSDFLTKNCDGACCAIHLHNSGMFNDKNMTIHQKFLINGSGFMRGNVKKLWGGMGGVTKPINDYYILTTEIVLIFS